MDFTECLWQGSGYKLRVPDILHANDVTLIDYDDPAQAQCLLDCLCIACALLEVDVDQDELAKRGHVDCHCLPHSRIPYGVSFWIV
jgi:hypothetical protein